MIKLRQMRDTIINNKTYYLYLYQILYEYTKDTEQLKQIKHKY